mmetsp:Transcript_32106/g.89892  ORF Transcript_32106/g.89892 Transcript_32106/m.89892 type:complete len:1661 (+) Transcript_32106:178-5160(+)
MVRYHEWKRALKAEISCESCGQFVSPTKAVRCRKCKLIIHKDCIEKMSTNCGGAAQPFQDVPRPSSESTKGNFPPVPEKPRRNDSKVLALGVCSCCNNQEAQEIRKCQKCGTNCCGRCTVRRHCHLCSGRTICPVLVSDTVSPGPTMSSSMTEVGSQSDSRRTAMAEAGKQAVAVQSGPKAEGGPPSVPGRPTFGRAKVRHSVVFGKEGDANSFFGETTQGDNRSAIFQWGGDSSAWKLEKLVFSEKIVKISAGGSQCAALTSNGRMYMWGKQRRGSGVLGIGLDAADISEPILVQQLCKHRIRDIACGPVTTAAVTVSGKLFMWGYKLDRGTPNFEPAALEAFENLTVKNIVFSVASALVLVQTGITDVDTDVYSWGEQPLLLGHSPEENEGEDLTIPRRIEGLVNESVVEISMSDTHCAAVTATGTVYTWGRNRSPQGSKVAVLGTCHDLSVEEVFEPCEVEMKTLRYRPRITSVACGQYFTVALSDHGLVLSWGFNYSNCCLGHGSGNFDSPTIITNLIADDRGRKIHVRGIQCGGRHCVAWTGEGEIYTWGSGRSYKLGDPESDSDMAKPCQVRVLESEGFRDGVVFQIGCTSDKTLAFVGPDVALIDFGMGVHPISAKKYSTVGNVVKFVAEQVKKRPDTIVMLGERYQELSPDTTLRSIIAKGSQPTFYLLRRHNNIAKYVQDGALRLDEKNLVTGGSIPALVEYLLDYWHTDERFNKTFLLMYQTFGITAVNFLRMLAQHFQIKGDPKQIPDQFPDEVRKKLLENIPRKRMVLYVIQQWITRHKRDFFNSEQGTAALLSELFAFLSSIRDPSLMQTCTNIRQILLFEMTDQMNSNHVVLNDLSSIVGPPISTKGVPPYMKYSAREVAEQLTFIDMKFTQALEESEFVGARWSKNKEAAPNVHRLAARATNMVFWAEKELLSASSSRELFRRAERLIEIGGELRAMGNFCGLVNIMATFGRKHVRRIPNLLKNIERHKDLDAKFKDLRETSSLLLKAGKWRSVFDSAPMPKIPFMAPIQTQIVFCDTLPKYVEEEKYGKELCNFSRAVKSALIIQDIKKYQTLAYKIEPIAPLLNYLYYARGFENHEKTATQLVQAMRGKGEVTDDVVEASAEDAIELYDASSTSASVDEDTETILLNHRASIAVLTRKERKRLWLSWQTRLQECTAAPIRKLTVREILSSGQSSLIASSMKYSMEGGEPEKKKDFRDILLLSSGIEISIMSLLENPAEDEEEDDAVRAILQTFKGAVDLDSFYNVLNVLSYFHDSMSPMEKEYLLSMVKLYKLKSKEEVGLPDEVATEIRTEIDGALETLKRETSQDAKIVLENMNKYHVALRSGEAAEKPKDKLSDSYGILKMRKVILNRILKPVEEEFGDDLLGRNEGFISFLRSTRENVLKSQRSEELLWLDELKRSIDTNMKELKRSGVSSLKLSVKQDMRTRSRSQLSSRVTTTRSGLKLADGKRGPSSFTSGSKLRGVSRTTLEGKRSTADTALSINNCLPSHFGFIADAVAEFPSPSPLAEICLDDDMAELESFFVSEHGGVCAEVVDGVAKLRQLNEFVGSAYRESMARLFTHYASILKQLQEVFAPMRNLIEMKLVSQNQLLGLQDTLAVFSDRVKELEEDLHLSGDNAEEAVAAMGNAEELLVQLEEFQAKDQ